MPAPLQIVVRAWYTEELQIPVRLSYAPDEDPTVVTMTFIEQAGGVDWMIGRELIANGLVKHVGLHDVEIWPVLNRVLVGLLSEEKPVIVEFDLKDVAAFIHATFLMVPNGQEFSMIDWDEELTKLLEQ